MLLTAEQKKRIEARIQAAEARTSGEIVVSVVGACDAYATVRWGLATLGAGIASAILGYEAHRHSWGFPVSVIVGWQLVGAAVFGVLGLLPPIVRFFLPERARAAAVNRECFAQFTAQGVSATRDRTGILILIARLERRVQILADEGIHRIAGEGYWKEQVDHIVRGLTDGRAAEAIGEAIERIGEKLAAHFPPRPDDTNELPNTVRERD